MQTLAALYYGLVLSVLGILLLNFVLNLRVAPRLSKASKLPPEPPMVSILVPARNEEVTIGRCLASLQIQDYPNYEVILLDDQSEDRTAEIARKLGFMPGYEKFRFVSGQPLPSGWVGKPWACHQLSQAARGEFLLFTDADTYHQPFALRAAMAQSLARNADLLSVWPFQETKTWSEKCVIPLLFVLSAAATPLWLLDLAQKRPALARLLGSKRCRSLGIACGQYILFKRTTYDSIGGHAGIANEIVEDITLGRIMAEDAVAGKVVQNCDGTHVVSTRMYQSFSQLWEGFTKNLWPVVCGNVPFFMLGLAVQFLVMILPILLLISGGWGNSLTLSAVTLIYILRFAIAINYRTSLLGTLLHPVGYALGIAMAINSFIRSHTGGVTWKGRAYRP
ncbi:MAG TPA: glycosyltransferase [Chthoniobacterales bacterium]